MHAYGLSITIAIFKIITLQHPRQGIFRRQAYHAFRTQVAHPLGVKTNFGLLAIQDLEDLGGVGLGVFFDLLLGQRLAGDVLARGVTDHTGEIANQERDLVAEILKLTHFIDHYGVADM